MIYLALYKGRTGGRHPRRLFARLQDRIIRRLTRSPYSHCEIAIALSNRPAHYRCYSSSPRDGGVRSKEMPLPPEKWDLLPLHQTEARRIARHYQLTAGAAYDWRGIIGTVFPRIGQSRSKWFCSEWCAAALGLPEPGRQTPQSLSEHLAAQPEPQDNHQPR